MTPTYLPIDHHFFELFEKEMKKGEAKVIYFAFAEDPELEEAKGVITKLEKQESGEFMIFENGEQVRVDRIIVFNGKPGPAYDEYDAYALAPLTCEAGYSDCNLD